jgi:hypothetical protein
MTIKKMLWQPLSGLPPSEVYHHGYAADRRAIVEICANGYVFSVPADQLSEVKRMGYVAIWRPASARDVKYFEYYPDSPGYVRATREEAEFETRDSNWTKVGVSKVEY